VKIVDTTPPNLTVTLSPTVLWPPDHKLIPITATITVSDTCDPSPTVKLVSITTNEPDNGLGDGDTVGDIQGADFGKDDRTFMLRGERSGKGNGRIYTVMYQASDASGNSTTKTATVIVPKSQAASK
jgi:endo-1,4-beta-xylanase